MKHSILIQFLESQKHPKGGVGGKLGTTDDVDDADTEPDYADPNELNEGEEPHGNGPMDQQDPHKFGRKKQSFGASRTGRMKYNPLDRLK